MTHLLPAEGLMCCDAFLECLFGEDLFSCWKNLKAELQFDTEKEFVKWILDTAIERKEEELLINRETVNATKEEELLMKEIVSTTTPPSTSPVQYVSLLSNRRYKKFYTNESVDENCSSLSDTLHNKDDESLMANVDVPAEGKTEIVVTSIHEGDDGDDEANINNVADPATEDVAGNGDADADIKPRGKIIRKCSYCASQFTALSSLRRHVSNIHRTTKKIHACSRCDKHLASAEDLVKHVALHHLAPKSSDMWRCPYCDKNLHDKRSLARHELRIHKRQSWCCQYCNKDLYSKRNLARHELLVHQRPSHNLSCRFCGKKLSTKYHVMRHERNVHALMKEFTCDKCHNSFGSKLAFLYHLKKFCVGSGKEKG